MCGVDLDIRSWVNDRVTTKRNSDNEEMETFLHFLLEQGRIIMNLINIKSKIFFTSSGLFLICIPIFSLFYIFHPKRTLKIVFTSSFYET